MTAGFGQRFAGPDGANFDCKWLLHSSRAYSPRIINKRAQFLTPR